MPQSGGGIYRVTVIDPSRDAIVADLAIELESLDEAAMPDFAREEVRESITGLRNLLAGLEDHGGDISAEAIQEIARAYLVGRRDAGGRLGGTVRRELWPRLTDAGLTF